MMAQDARIARYVQECPPKHRNSLARALQGEISPRQAIRVKCLACCNFERLEAQNCTVRICPLWKYRPYQSKDCS